MSIIVKRLMSLQGEAAGTGTDPGIEINLSLDEDSKDEPDGK